MILVNELPTFRRKVEILKTAHDSWRGLARVDPR